MDEPKKFFKTVIRVEVLSEYEPVLEGTDLSVIAEQIDTGDWSGSISVVETKELTAKEAADALVAQGSDPEFFQIDEEGNEVG